MFSKKATIIDEIFTADLTVTTYCQIDGEDFVNFCGLLRKRELYTLQFGLIVTCDSRSNRLGDHCPKLHFLKLIFSEKATKIGKNLSIF